MNNTVHPKNDKVSKMQTIDEVQQEIIDEFALYDDWMDKYAVIIEQGNALQPLEEKYKIPENIIEGCQSRVWLQTDFRDGKLYFQAESDAIIVKGLLALVLKVFNERTPDEIINTDLRFMKEIGLTDHLSPTRSNGLLSVIKQIRFYAIAFKSRL